MTLWTRLALPFEHTYGSSAYGSVSGQDAPKKMVVVGINNVRLRDEGAVAYIVNAPASGYQENNNVAIVDSGTAGMELLPLLEGADHLIVVDAIRCGQPPTSIVRLEDA